MGKIFPGVLQRPFLSFFLYKNTLNPDVFLCLHKVYQNFDFHHQCIDDYLKHTSSDALKEAKNLPFF